MPKSIADADCPYFCFLEKQLFFDLHKRRAAHAKHIKVIKLANKHDLSSFVIWCVTLYACFCGLSIGFFIFLNFYAYFQKKSGRRYIQNAILPTIWLIIESTFWDTFLCEMLPPQQFLRVFRLQWSFRRHLLPRVRGRWRGRHTWWHQDCVQ